MTRPMTETSMTATPVTGKSAWSGNVSTRNKVDASQYTLNITKRNHWTACHTFQTLSTGRFDMDDSGYDNAEYYIICLTKPRGRACANQRSLTPCSKACSTSFTQTSIPRTSLKKKIKIDYISNFLNICKCSSKQLQQYYQIKVLKDQIPPPFIYHFQTHDLSRQLSPVSYPHSPGDYWKSWPVIKRANISSWQPSIPGYCGVEVMLEERPPDYW